MPLNNQTVRTVAAAVTLALAGGAASLAFAQQQPAADATTPPPMHVRDHGPHGGPGGPGGGPMGFGGPREMRKLLDGVGATEAQRTQIRQLMETAQPDLRAQREAASALREEQLKLLAQPTLDAAAAEALRQKMLAQHDQVTRRQMTLLMDVSAVLTPEQRAKVVTQMDDMRKRHSRGPRPTPAEPKS